MEDKDKTGDELTNEMENLRHRVSELEQSEARLKEIEQLLKEGEERYRVLVENLNEGIFVVKDGAIRFINPRAVEFTGYSADEMTSKPFLEFVHPDDREMVLKRHMSRMAGDDTPHEYTVRIINRDGNINWLLVMSRMIPWQGEIAALVSATDITLRKAAEDALRESEQRLRTVAENITEVFWLADIQTGKTFYVSPGYERVWGRSVASLYEDPRSFLEAVHAEDRKRVASDLETKKHGQPFELEYRVVRSDGDIRWISDRAFPVLDEMGAVTRYVGVAQDITDRKKAEDERRESERKYRDLIEGAPVGIFQSTFDGKVLGVNPAYALMYGYASAEEAALEIDSVAERIYVEPERRKMLIDLALSTDGFVKAENQYRKKDGSLFWGQLHFRVIRDCDGEPKHLEGFVEDITERKESQEELRKNEERYRAVFNNSAVGISVSDRNGKIINVNPAMLKMLGYTQQELESAQFADITHPDDVEISRDKFGALVRGEIEPYRIEKRYIRKDGEIVWVDLSVAPIVDKKGVCVATFGMTVDITERKRSEEALREANETFFTFADQLPAKVFIKDHSSRLQYINKYLREVNDSEDWIGRDASEYFPPEVAKAVLADEKKVFLDGPVLKEEWIPDKKGVKRLWETRKFPIHREGKPPLLGGVSIDITDRKRAEQALRDSENLLKGILSTSPIGISLTYDRKIKWVNEAWLKMFGFDDEQECVGQDTRILYPSEEEFRRVGKAIYTDTESQEVTKTDGTFKRKDGSVFDALTSIRLLDPSSPDKGRVAAIADISAWKQAEQALRASETRYRRLFEAAKDGILILDADTAGIVDVNPSLTELLGYSHEQLLEKKLWEIGIFEDPSKCHAVFRELQSKEYARYDDLPLQKKGGASIEVEFVSNIYQVNGKKVIQCNIRDVTDRKRLERQLLQSQKMEAVGILAGGVAHDFNNLLTVIQGFSELLLLEMDEKAPGFADLLKIQESALRGAELVRNLLAFSRKVETKPRPIKLNHEVVKIEKLLSRTIPKMIKIELHLEGDLAAVNADPDQMGQVLMNLAVNAEQAMPDGGNLTIATANISLDEGYCRSYPEIHPGDYVLLIVSDTGHGMQKETLEHIFEPFFTTKGVGKGTGLGLAMVYGIVRQHGGLITCDTQPNEGATFKIYLPAMEEDRIEKEDREELALPRGGAETILLVDDEDFVRDLGTRFLTRVGYTVLTAASGPEAVRLYLKEAERISLVILDLIMPEMGGEKCLEEILAINPDAKIVISSGAVVEDKKKGTLESGARGFVNKPFRLRDMLKTVREVLDSA